jgi:hypothetical protein
MITKEPFRIEVTIAAPVEEVWRSLREPARIRHWHGWDFDGLDAEVEVIYRQDVIENEAEHTLSVQGGDTFTLHDVGGGRTVVRMVRAPRGDNPEWDAYYDDINEGWTTFMQQLRFALERHPGAERRTIFLDGGLGGQGGPIEVLGLPSAGRYQAELAGAPETGEVWFRSTNQVGVTVEGWGDGLLIVGAAPVSPAKPRGSAMAVLTTYGLDDAALDTLRERWTAWWRQHHPAQETDAPADQPVSR